MLRFLPLVYVCGQSWCCASFSKGWYGTVFCYDTIGFKSVLDAEKFITVWTVLCDRVKFTLWYVYEQFLKLFIIFLWLYAYGYYFLFLLCPLWSIILIVITGFKVGSFWLNGLLCHLLNVNKDIYEFFPWKEIWWY